MKLLFCFYFQQFARMFYTKIEIDFELISNWFFYGSISRITDVHFFYTFNANCKSMYFLESISSSLSIFFWNLEFKCFFFSKQNRCSILIIISGIFFLIFSLSKLKMFPSNTFSHVFTLIFVWYVMMNVYHTKLDHMNGFSLFSIQFVITFYILVI